jgi:hypothetical protein
MQIYEHIQHPCTTKAAVAGGIGGTADTDGATGAAGTNDAFGAAGA